MCSKCTTIDTGNTHNEHFFSSTDGGDKKVRCNTGENPRSTVSFLQEGFWSDRGKVDCYCHTYKIVSAGICAVGSLSVLLYCLSVCASICPSTYLNLSVNLASFKLLPYSLIISGQKMRWSLYYSTWSFHFHFNDQKSMMKTEIQKELWFWRRKGMVVVQHPCPLDYGGRKQI